MPSQGFLGKIVFNAIYKLTDYVVGNSLPVLKFLKENNGVKIKKLRLISNPILFRQLRERNTSANTFNIVSVSRLEKVKNIEAVINVVKKLTNEGFAVRYTIVGSGIIENKLKAQVKTLHLENVILFSGFVSDPYPSLLKADLYIINSFAEGFSNSLLESMYSGTPSISSKSGSAEEIIEHEINGWLVDVDDKEKLYVLIKQVISLDTMEREKIGLNGKKTVENKYSLSNHINKLLEIYK
jgi:glycosyltransferase involved in cell wall biosynthesis